MARRPTKSIVFRVLPSINSNSPPTWHFPWANACGLAFAEIYTFVQYNARSGPFKQWGSGQNNFTNIRQLAIILIEFV